MKKIILRCPMCPAQTEVARLPTDPPAATVVELPCDRHRSADETSKPKYFDANNEPVNE